MPHLFPLNQLNLNNQSLGITPSMWGIIAPPIILTISGISKDSSGAALGNCIVNLFRTNDNQFIQQTTSDGSGNYAFSVGLGQYYIVSYKVGAPDVAGTTVNTLVGT